MINELENFKKIIATELGISVSEIPNSILYKIYHDDLFLHHLSICKSDKTFLKMLINESQNNNLKLPNNKELFLKLSNSLTGWLAAGLKQTTNYEFEKRIAICNICPNRVIPSGRLLYSLIKAEHICGLCGCDIQRKARLASETCPDKDENGHGKW